MDDAAYFREKAEQCRRLAGAILTRGDPTKEAMLALSREFDLKAVTLEAQSATARQIGDGIPSTGTDEPTRN